MIFGFFLIATPIVFAIALMQLIRSYFDPPKSLEATKRRKTFAWSLWTAGALSVTYWMASYLYSARMTDNFPRDFDYWLGYTLDVAKISGTVFLPAGIYWVRFLISKGRG